MEAIVEILTGDNALYVVKDGAEYCVFPLRHTPPNVDTIHWARLLGALHRRADLVVRQLGHFSSKGADRWPEFRALYNVVRPHGKDRRHTYDPFRNSPISMLGR